MKMRRLAGTLLICLSAAAHAWPASAQDAPLFRVFLNDGRTLTSYGELARVGDRVVFSMPTSASADRPDLQLVTITSGQVDWKRTSDYAESVRASRYVSTRAESDYAALTAEIERTLNEVAVTSDPVARLSSVLKARKALADWPATHFNFRQDDIHQMLGILDEAIADLRAATGADQFNLSFVAGTAPPKALPPLLPPPTPKEAIEQTLTAAEATASPAERTSLLAAVLTSLDRNATALPAEWATSTRISTKASIARELAIDESYRTFTTRTLNAAVARAKAADVRGVQQLLAAIPAKDDALGGARPDSVNGLVAAVREQLDAARRLRLERDRWALRMPAFQRYRRSVTGVLAGLAALNPPLEDIKALSGSTPAALDGLEHSAEQLRRTITLIEPPDEFRDAHALLTSAAQLALNAATIRRQATLAGDIARAWDASSAAAGAMMLAARAQSDIQALFRLPQLSQ